MPTNKKQLSLVMPFDLYDEICAYAMKESISQGKQISPSQVMRDALHYYIEHNYGKTSDKPPA